MADSLPELWARIVKERNVEMNEGDIEETLFDGTVHRGRILFAQVGNGYLTVKVSWIAAKRADNRWELTGVVQDFLYDLIGVNGVAPTSAPTIDEETGRITFTGAHRTVTILPHYDPQRLPADPAALRSP